MNFTNKMFTEEEDVSGSKVTVVTVVSSNNSLMHYMERYIDMGSERGSQKLSFNN